MEIEVTTYLQNKNGHSATDIDVIKNINQYHKDCKFIVVYNELSSGKMYVDNIHELDYCKPNNKNDTGIIKDIGIWKIKYK